MPAVENQVILPTEIFINFFIFPLYTFIYIMDEELERITKDLGKKLRTLLKREGLYDNNFDFEISIGKYTVLYSRSCDPKNEPLTEFPEEFHAIIQAHILEMKRIWEKYEESEPCYADDSLSEYSIESIIDGGIDMSITIEEMERQLATYKNRLEEEVQEENYTEAARLQKLIKSYVVRIEQARQSQLNVDKINSD